MSWTVSMVHAVLAAGTVPLMALLFHAIGSGVPGVAAPVRQPWLDVARLWRKGSAVPEGATALYAAGPPVALAVTVAALSLVPSFSLGSAVGQGGDLLVLFGLMAASRGVLSMAALDGGAMRGSTPGLTLGPAVRLGIWPVVALIVMGATLVSGGTNLQATATAVRDGGGGARLAGLFAGAAVFVLSVAEPAIRGGVFGGRHQAFIRVAGWTQRVAMLSVAVALALPFGIAPPGAGPGAWAVGAVLWVVKISVLTGIAAMFGPRASPSPVLLPAAGLLAMVAVVLAGAPGPA